MEEKATRIAEEFEYNAIQSMFPVYKIPISSYVWNIENSLKTTSETVFFLKHNACIFFFLMLGIFDLISKESQVLFWLNFF